MGTKLLVCLVMLAVVSAVPLNIKDDFDNDFNLSTYQCAKECKAPTFKFKYEPSKTYVYEYQAEVETSMAGASEEKAKMLIETHANIEVISKCEFALRLQNVKIYHSEPYVDYLKPAAYAQEFQMALTANALRFSFDDGIIRDICHPSQEEIWVLNFKRGLLSAFQNSMDDLKKDTKVKEVDVSGECETQYNKTSEWMWEQTLKVSKTKNLLACYKHSGRKSIIPMVPYKVASEIQSLPIMKSSQECKQTISSSNILSSATCEESHIFAPFSNQQSGASTKVKQTLTFKVMKSGIETSESNIEVQSKLLFQHMNGIDEIQNSREAAEQKLKELCEQTKFDIRPETPRLFAELVQIVKVLDGSEIRDLRNMIRHNKLCSLNDKAKKFLYDTLPIAATPGAVEVMVRIINKDEIPDVEKHIWLTSLSLIQDPSKNLLDSLLKLLNGKFAEQSLLPISALLNTMCSKNVECDNNPIFRNIVSKMNKNINSYCTSTDENLTMRTLRAIGNIGYGKDFLPTLNNCMTSKYSPLEHKVAAADAYRKFICQEDEETGTLFEVFGDKDADPELRMVSFLSLMRCPRHSILQKIAHQLDIEEDDNVGSFVYTHLKNLLKTSDPHKQDIAEAVRGLILKPFDDTGLKSSKSFENSALLNRLNLGYGAEADIMWAPQTSAIPRSARLNLTMELFGNSINVFEVGAHVDGIEHFVQKYFGKKGYFADSKSGRDDLHGFLYARMFGNEFFFKEMKGVKHLQDIQSYINLDKILENLSKDFNYKFSHTQQLFDESLIIPTLIGLPLNLTANSSVTVNTEAKGKIDLKGILSRSKPIIITTDIAASGGMEVTGSMMVDAHFYKQGLRMRNTLHSSVTFKPSVRISNREIVDIEIESPQEKQELFDARSQYFIIHDNFEKEQEMIKENAQNLNYCSGDKFAKITGLELCADLQYSNASMKEDAPYFPFTGPASAKVTLDKKDTQRTYKFFAKWKRNSKRFDVQVILDTPGSKVDRHISTEATIGMSKDKNIELALYSPWKNVVVKGMAVAKKEIVSLTGSVVVDFTKQYRLTSKLKMNNENKRHEYLPFLEIEYPDNSRVSLLTGSIVYNENKDVAADLQVKDFNKNVYLVQSNVVNHKMEKRIEISFQKKNEKTPYKLMISSSQKQSGKKNQNTAVENMILIQTPKYLIVSYTSKMQYQPKPVKLIVTMNMEGVMFKKPVFLSVSVLQKRLKYPVKAKFNLAFVSGDLTGIINPRKHKGTMTLKYKTSSKKDRIDWSGKYYNRSRNSHKQYEINSLMTFKSMPEYNTKTIMKITHKKDSTFDMKVNYGKNLEARKSKKFLQIKVTANSEIKNIKQALMNANLMAKMPEKDVDIKIAVDHTHNEKKIDSEVKLHLLPFVENDINAGVLLQMKGKTMFTINADCHLEVKGKKFKVSSNLIQKSKKRFEHSLTATSDGKMKHKVETVYKNNAPTYEIVTDIESSQLDKPLNLLVMAVLKSPTDIQVKGVVTEDKNSLYSIEASSKLEKDIAGKWILQIEHPERKVKANMRFTKDNSKIKADAYVNWDVHSKQKPVPEIQIELSSYSKPDSLSIKNKLDIRTPFESYEKLIATMNLVKSESELKTNGKINWGGPRKQISSELTAELPISVENTKISFHAKTPFKKCKEVELKVDHAINSEFKTKLAGKLEKDKDKIALKVEHLGDENEVITSVSMAKNEETYTAEMKIDRSKPIRSGRIMLNGPNRKFETYVHHETQPDGKQMMAVGVANTKNNRKMDVVSVMGSYLDINHFHLDLVVDSKKVTKKIRAEINHQLEEGKLISKIIFVKGRAQTGFDVKLKDDQSQMSADVLFLLSPMYEKDVKISSEVQYGVYPVTASTQISWDSSSVIDLSGSYKAETTDDMGLSLRLTTPFEKLENINVVASHTVKNSLRVSHLNIDYDIRKMIDIEIKSQNDELKKVFRIKMISPQIQKLRTGITVDLKKGMMSKANFNLVLDTQEKYNGLVVLEVSKDSNVKGEIDFTTPIEGFEKIEGSFVKQNGKDDRKDELKLKKNNEILADILVQKKKVQDWVSFELVIKGKLVEVLAMTGDELSQVILPNYVRSESWKSPISHDLDGNMIKEIVAELKIQQKDQVSQLKSAIILDYEVSQVKHAINIHQVGDEWNDVSLQVALTMDKKTLKVEIVSQLQQSINLKTIVTDSFDRKYGVEFSHKGDTNKFKTKGLWYFGDLKPFEDSLEFSMDEIHHIELTATHKTPWRGYELISLKYKHEGQDDRVSCSLSLEDDKKHIINIDMVAERVPSHIFSLKVTSSFKELDITGSYDDTKVHGLIKVEDQVISISGTHDNFDNVKVTVKTPLHLLQLLTIETDGQLADGKSNFILKFNDNNQVDGNLFVKFEDYSQMSITAALHSSIEDSENNIKLEVGNEDKPRKVSHFLLVLNDENKIKIEGQWESKHEDSKNVLDVEILYPALGIKTQGVIFNVEGNKEKAWGNIQVLDDSRNTVLDADINMDKSIGSIIVRQPRPMEYKLVLTDYPETNKNEIYFNWDKSNPDAHLMIESVMKDVSNYYKTEKSMSLTITCPKRMIGVEYTIAQDKVSHESSGKIFWNDDDDSQLSYNLKLNDLSNRRKYFYEGDFKIQVPARTIGFSGSLSDTVSERQAESSFSWDLDNDKTKKIGVNAKMLKTTHKEAHVSLLLPEDAHIDSKLIFYKGNTILEGQTQIVYSEDSSKTLTLFSKVENIPGYDNLFFSEHKSNYSIQVGVSHPDSRLDVKMDSHLGVDKEKLTTSIGLDYLTFRKQQMNMNLFGEINKLKKEINLYATSPYKTLGFTSTIVSQDPLELKAKTTVDDVERRTVHLLLNPTEKKVDLDMVHYGKGVSLSAFYPDQKTFQLDMNRVENGEVKQENKVVLLLASPNVLQTTLDWTPGLLVKVRDSLYENMKMGTTETKRFIDEVAMDLEKEFTRKYKQLTDSVYGDVKSLINSMEQELVSIETDLEKLKDNLQSNFDFCSMKIGDIDLNQEIAELQKKVRTYVEKMDEIISFYTESCRKGLNHVSEKFEEIKNGHISKAYEKFVSQIGKAEVAAFNTWFWYYSSSIKRISSEEMEKFWKLLDEVVVEMDPQPLIDSINKQVKEFMNSRVSVHILKVVESNTHLASKLKTMILQMKENVENHPFTQDIVTALEDSVNVVYQQGKWTYNYLNLEETVTNNVDRLVNLINEVIEQELGSVYTVIQNPITHFDSEEGLLKAKFLIPISLERLDKFPSYNLLPTKMVKNIQKLIGNSSTLFYQPKMEVMVDDVNAF